MLLERHEIDPAVAVVRGAGALARHHERTHGGFRRARGTEYLALVRLDHALQHFAALARLRIGDLGRRHGELALGVELGECRADAYARMIDRPEPSPLEELAQLE